MSCSLNSRKVARPVTTERNGVIAAIVAQSVRRRGLVFFLAVLAAVVGALSFRDLLIDAVPDITNVQVVINAEAAGFTPLEVEQLVTYPLETALGGLPRLQSYRSLSRYGLGQITVIFEDGTDLYFARQLVSERLQRAAGELPEGIEPSLGPVATGLGEIYSYTLAASPGARDEHGRPNSPASLRTLHDYFIRPRLLKVPGVAEINVIGGEVLQYHVTPDPVRLASFGLTITDVATAIRAANASAGAGYIEDRGQQELVRVPGQISSPEQIAEVVIAWRDRVPIHVRDVAQVADGSALRSGAGTVDGEEAIVGTAVMLVGENSRQVAQAVAKAIDEMQSSLPSGVRIVPLYDRTALVERTIGTVRENLLMGATLVVFVLLIALGNLRAALITAAVIPLAMLLTISGMVKGHVSGNLMSLGALDFGLIVDGAVIIVENCIRRLGEVHARLGRTLNLVEREETVTAATREVLRPAVFGVFVVTIVYVPVLTLGGVEGKTFAPMAITVIVALLSALAISVTVVPAAVMTFLAGHPARQADRLWARFESKFRAHQQHVQDHRATLLFGAIAIVIVTGVLATRLGREFMPTLDEGDLTVQALRPVGISLTQAVEMQRSLERELLKIAEVGYVFAREGTDELAADPIPPGIADTFVMLKPRAQWPDPHMTKAGLVEKVRAVVATVPGANYDITQPIQERFNDLIAGTRSDLAIKVFGDDLETLLSVANRVAGVTSSVPGSADVRVEQLLGLPLASVEARPKDLARYGVRPEALRDTVQAAVGGASAGSLVQGDRRFEIVIRLSEPWRTRVNRLERLAIPTSEEGRTVPLKAVADIRLRQAPDQINREDGKRRVVVAANVSGRDLGSFVAQVQQEIGRKVKVPSGYWIEYGGAFEQFQSAVQRLSLVVPLTFMLIGALLYAAFQSVRDALIVFTGVPLALTGGIIALWLTDTSFSITAAVGFIAVSGVAVLNGLVLVEFIRQRLAAGEALATAIEDAAATRLRPVLMTASVASLGLLPMALNTGVGSEVQRPLAIVVIGGLVTSTALTLIVLPALYGAVARPPRATP
jgi:cobalt-zinc-cadmium resistance protein CzcA